VKQEADTSFELETTRENAGFEPKYNVSLEILKEEMKQNEVGHVTQR
jgi:hypothetical protein